MTQKTLSYFMVANLCKNTTPWIQNVHWMYIEHLIYPSLYRIYIQAKQLQKFSVSLPSIPEIILFSQSLQTKTFKKKKISFMWNNDTFYSVSLLFWNTKNVYHVNYARYMKTITSILCRKTFHYYSISLDNTKSYIKSNEK